MKFDVVVIGAGAAGLAAARELSGSGKRVCVIEARQRAGGRVLTVHVPGLPLPIELGAEFIHGEAHETFSIVEAAALIACELPDNHWWSRDGKWQQLSDFWEIIQNITKKIDLKRDVSFDAFLRSRRSITPRQRELARSFAEGYHAAHADRISAMALSSADEEQDDSAGGNKQFRILGGYDALIEWLRAGLNPGISELRFGTTVRQVTWSNGEVTIDCLHGKREETIRAGAAIVTVPIGVWKAAREQEGAIRFDPPLDEKMRAVGKIEVGHVVKIMFRFRERFWDEEQRDEPVNFVHASDRFVQTWWTSAPVRSPILTAWSGGHAADAMLAEGDEGMIDRALDSMAKTFGERRRRIDDLLAGAYMHNWQSDPFSRGAYSYAGVGGAGAHQALSRPVGSTLFFAGEATNGEQTGTVAGAIESGVIAARRLLSK